MTPSLLLPRADGRLERYRPGPPTDFRRPQAPLASRRLYPAAHVVADPLAPPPDMLLGRGMMGDGVIDLRALRRSVDRAGYDGPIEVEIFNQALWDTPGDEVVRRVQARFTEHVLG